jgi:hypothetical protein
VLFRSDAGLFRPQKADGLLYVNKGGGCRWVGFGYKRSQVLMVSKTVCRAP